MVGSDVSSFEIDCYAAEAVGVVEAEAVSVPIIIHDRGIPRKE